MSTIFVCLVIIIFLMSKSIGDEAVRHCWVVGTDIECDSNYSKEFNLYEEFSLISKDCVDSCIFDNLWIHRTNLERLDIAHHGKLSFHSIHIYSADRLFDVKLSPAQSSQLDRQLFINSPSSMTSDAICQMLTTMTNLKQIETSFTKQLRLSSLPKLLSHLEYFTLIPGDQDSVVIDDYVIDAFVNLKAIKFAGVTLSRIDKKALHIHNTQHANETLMINFDNCNIQNELLSDMLETSNLRPIQLNLGKFEGSVISKRFHLVLSISDNNKLTLISSNVFAHFLWSLETNTMSIFNNPIDCSQMRPHAWLLKEKQRFRHQVYGATCTTGQDLFAMEYYRGKCDWSHEDKLLQCQDIYDPDFNIHSEVIYAQEYEQVETIETLLINNCSIEYFRANSFEGVVVHKIWLHNLPNLQGIHRHAFGDSPRVLKISGPNRLVSTVGEYDLWSLITSLPSLVSVQLSLASSFVNIPSLRLAQTSLQSVVFDRSNYKIANIESFAFHVSCLMDEIVFRGVAIYKVHSHAFTTTAHRCPRCLAIDMSECNMNEQTLAAQAFSTLNRPLCLNISKSSCFVFCC